MPVRKLVMVVFVSAVLFVLPLAVNAQHSNAVPVLTSYFDLLESGNYESARLLWTKKAQERSSRLGIQYKDIPLKIDCVSPIVQDLKTMKKHLQPPVRRYNDLAGGAAQELHYSAVVNGHKVEHTYYAEYDGRYYWLTFPQDIFTRDWPIRETEYFRIHVHPTIEKHFNSLLFEEADEFVRRIADSLGLSEYDKRHLQSTKIEYFYCATDKQVEEITGKRTIGLYDKPSGDIISSFFPHYHEVVHLLIEYKLSQLPLFAHPLFEEGLAVHFGGRWGKSIESLMPLGIFLYNEGIMSLDSLLSYDGFRSNAESDLAYPLAGLFNRFLLERIGRQRLLALYRNHCGSFDKVSSLSPDEFKAAVLKALRIKSWERFLEIFGDYLNTLSEKHVAARPGGTETAKLLFENDLMAVKENSDWLEFEFNSKSDAAPVGSFLFGRHPSLAGAEPVMFIEHFPEERTFDGYRYGVRFDANEAGLYDYATNYLIGKYILALDPSPEYFDQESNRISIRFKKDLTGGVVPLEDDYKLLNH